MTDPTATRSIVCTNASPYVDVAALGQHPSGGPWMAVARGRGPGRPVALRPDAHIGWIFGDRLNASFPPPGPLGPSAVTTADPPRRRPATALISGRS